MKLKISIKNLSFYKEVKTGERVVDGRFWLRYYLYKALRLDRI